MQSGLSFSGAAEYCFLFLKNLIKIRGAACPREGAPPVTQDALEGRQAKLRMVGMSTGAKQRRDDPVADLDIHRHGSVR